MTPPAGPAQPATHVAQARRGGLLDVKAVVVSAATEPIGMSPGYRVTLLDDADELDLLFLGRGYVGGFTAGRRCAVTGRAALRGHRLVVWNPRYALLPGALAQVGASTRQPRRGSHGQPDKSAAKPHDAGSSGEQGQKA